MTEQIDWQAKQPLEMACVSDQKCWDAWDSTCGYTASQPLITERRDTRKRKYQLYWRTAVWMLENWRTAVCVMKDSFVYTEGQLHGCWCWRRTAVWMLKASSVDAEGQLHGCWCWRRTAVWIPCSCIVCLLVWVSLFFSSSKPCFYLLVSQLVSFLTLVQLLFCMDAWVIIHLLPNCVREFWNRN